MFNLTRYERKGNKISVGGEKVKLHVKRWYAGLMITQPGTPPYRSTDWQPFSPLASEAALIVACTQLEIIITQNKIYNYSGRARALEYVRTSAHNYVF